MTAIKSLEEELVEKKKEITTDGYPMSIGELVSLYKEGELDIHPEFQRFFRWTILQKSKLIESILLGIPLPSIFVAQREDGIWDVVDGLQRLSTIFEFLGILKEEGGNLLPASKLVKTNYLTLLENKVWEDENDSANSFTSSQRISFKREKIDVKIVKKESHESVKFELFQRLNTLGTKLSDQEVRNCLLVLINRDFYWWLRDLSLYDNFLNTLSLTDRLMDEQYNMELALRFLIFKTIDPKKVKSTVDLNEFITTEMVKIVDSDDFNKYVEEVQFKKTFDLLFYSCEDNAFKKYELTKNRFEGKFLLSAFEAVAVGLGRNIHDYPTDIEPDLKNILREKIINLWSNENFQARYGSGVNVTSRVPIIIPLGEKIFSV